MTSHFSIRGAHLATMLLIIADVHTAAAQPPQPKRVIEPVSTHAAHMGFAPQSPPYLIGLQASLSGDYPVIGANADGTDLWPCVDYQGVNLDCPRIGKPGVRLPGYGIVTGFPAYSWTLQNTPGRGNGIGCDALINGTGTLAIPYKPCAQISTWYEDATNDSTDDLIWHVRVMQGSTVIYDSGLQDYGPAGPSVTYPVHVVLAADANFGYWPGAEYGPNNGDCGTNILYPLQSPAFPGRPYQVATGQTCAEPVAGPAKVLTRTILATPTYTQVTGAACTRRNVPSPCYTVAWAKKYEIHQDFDFALQ
jgi:hypothetical protein